jgi:hypothetical protein
MFTQPCKPEFDMVTVYSLRGGWRIPKLPGSKEGRIRTSDTWLETERSTEVPKIREHSKGYSG